MYGVRRAIHEQTADNQSDLVITIKRATSSTDVAGTLVQQTTLTRNTRSTKQMLLNTGQAGVIIDASQANAGPIFSVNNVTYNSGGYTPLVVTNSTGADQDYWVEFTQVGEANLTDGQRFSVYDLWDFTVISGTTEKPGRMRSKLWSFSAGGADNVFSKDFSMFPLIPSTDQAGAFFVKKFSLAGIAPQNFFRFVTNSNGSNTSAGSTFEARRKSQNSQLDYPEYFNFVNNPDEEFWPSATAPTFSVAMASSCNTTTNGGKTIFTLNTSESSTFVVLINLNGVAGYQAGSADVLIESTGGKGTRQVEWNGLNGLGQVVAKNTTLSYLFRNGSAPVNFPVWDAEANVTGFKVKDIRPLAAGTSADPTVFDGLLFWDDSNLSTTLFPAPQTELFGVSSETGAHKWGSTANTVGDLKTINTWTYGFTNSSSTSTTFNYDCSADVAVTNTASGAPFAVGKPFTYTVTVTNNGPLPATNIVVTDKLDPATLQFVSASDAAYNSSTGVWTVGSLAVGTSKTLTISATPLVAGSVSTTATQTHTEADGVTTNDNATSTITVQSAADIAVTNTVPKASYYNGEIVTFTVTAKNLGPNAATGVSITEALPAGLTLEGTAPAGYNASTGVWTVGSLAINETKTLTLTARTAQSGTITTTASLNSRTGFEVDLNDNNNASSTTITVSPAADVAVTSTVNNNSPVQGETITYTIKAINNGPNNATNLTLNNQLPAGLTLVSATPSFGTYNAATGLWTIGTLTTNGTQTLTILARPTVTGSLVVTSAQSHTETDTQSSNNAASSTITVSATADVAVMNVITSPAKTTYANGDAVTYTVMVTNNGPSAATSVVVTDKLPASLTFVSATNSAGTGSYNSATGEWSVGTLANGTSATLTLTATVNQSAAITTTATQTHSEFDNVAGNNVASTTITSGSGVITADLKVSVSATDGPYYTGKQLTLTALVENIGPDAATGVSLDALVPAGFTLLNATSNVGTYNTSTGLWTVGSLASGSKTELVLTVVPVTDNSVTGNKNYTFTATKKTANETDNNASNNSASTVLAVQKAADPSVTVAVTGDVNGVFYKGITEATFVLTVTNNGPDKITNLVGADTRTGTITFTYAESGKGYDPATGIWTVPVLEAGQSITLLVKGIPNTTGRLFLGGSVTSLDQTDLNKENDKGIALLTVVPVADLQVTNTVAAGSFYNGENITFTVSVKNNSTDAATGVKLEDILPAGLTYVNTTTSAGTYDPATGIWTLGTDLLAGSTQTLSLTVKPSAGGTYSTTASVKAANEFDSNTANNTATASVTVQKTADIALSSTIVAGPYYINGQYQVAIKATNLGPDLATGVVVSARVATGVTLVAGTGVTDGGTITPATGTWFVGDIGVNETKTLTFLAQPTVAGTMNSRGYKSGGNEYDPNGGLTQDGNNSALVSFTVVDRPASYSVYMNNRHFFLVANGENVAVATDPDGTIASTRIISGTLPAGLTLQNNGALAVINRFAVRPGTYALTLETTDIYGGTSTHNVSVTFNNDFDQDGVNDFEDIDDNNDGLTDATSCGGADPFGDSDSDGELNYYDRNFVHPVFGNFKDLNLDGINDWFDMDLDGILNNLDVDVDGDGITNVVEANGGTTNVTGYNLQTGKLTGAVNQYGLPLAAQATDPQQSKFPTPDTDSDGIKDFLDLDSDNDGILDNIEAQTTAGFRSITGLDSNFDGLDDSYEGSLGGNGLTPIDSDKDGKPDYLDLNTDGDLAPDFAEAFDDNGDGISEDDLKARASVFETNTNKNFYVNSSNGTADWLKLVNGYPAFLTKGNSYYYDTDQDGLVDLFDADNGGQPASMQKVSNNEYAFRNAEVVTPLPVTLISFTAKAQKDGVLLNWATASEKDNAFFIVERSADGKSFSAVGKVAGAGNSTIKIDYTFLDAHALTGTAYYRLKQVDLDGKFEYSKVVAVQTKAAVAGVSLKVFPNPTTGVVSLDLTSATPASVTVKVFALDGRLIKATQMMGGAVQTLDLSNLAIGTYLINVAGANIDTTVRVVKN
ncbi:hypothetical protein GCM10027189_04880 [Rufibacter soli]